MFSKSQKRKGDGKQKPEVLNIQEKFKAKSKSTERKAQNIIESTTRKTQIIKKKKRTNKECLCRYSHINCTQLKETDHTFFFKSITNSNQLQIQITQQHDWLNTHRPNNFNCFEFQLKSYSSTMTNNYSNLDNKRLNTIYQVSKLLYMTNI